MKPLHISALASLVQIGSHTAQCLLIAASKREDGTFSYDANEAVQIAEVLKLLFAMGLLPKGVDFSIRRSLPFAGVAVLYAVQNNLMFEALRHLVPHDYQLLNNMKLLTTSLAFRVVVKRKLRVLQWLALLFLALGMSLAVTTAQARCGAAAGQSSLRGVWVMVLISWCSAFAGVYNELLLKQAGSMFEGNVYLYSYGVGACFVPLLWRESADFVPFRGFTALTWAVVISNAILGQAISYVFRYADSIVKLYSACASVALTALLSSVLFGTAVSVGTALAYLVCLVSFCIYHASPALLLKEM